MSDLLDRIEASADDGDYTARHIEVLEGLEPVRRRPGMYIGGTDAGALHHLVAELLDNAMDEAVAGHANRIEIELAVDGRVTVRDNGRGIPVDPHPKFPKKSALEVILTTLHSGGKFADKAYQTAGGLHGVGISVVNALAGIVGGGLGGQILSLLGLGGAIAGGASGGFDLGAVAGQIASGGVGGAVVLSIVGVVRNALGR